MITRNTTARSRMAQQEKGFTLTEIAIVLGIIGLILGAIWVAASGVYNNQKVGKANTEILTIAQGIRSLYSTSSTTGDSAGASENGTFFAAGIFPNDMGSSSTTLVDPWGGSITVTTQTFSTAGDAFGIEFTSVSQAGCIGLLTQIGGQNHEPGLIYANATATASAKGATSWSTGTSLTLPITASGAAAACAAGTNANAVQFAFKLKG